MAKTEKYDAKHRAEDQKDKKSTSQRTEGDRNDASRSAHRHGVLGLGMGSRNLKGPGHDYSRGDSE